MIYNAPTDIILPAGTVLPIHLDLVVPVDQQIPVELNVAVDIPLNQTDLHTPFVGLQQVLDPYYTMLESPARFLGGDPVRSQSRVNSAKAWYRRMQYIPSTGETA